MGTTRQISDPTNTSYNSGFGTSVALSARGPVVAIGAPGATSLPNVIGTFNGVTLSAGGGTSWTLETYTQLSASNGEQLG